MGGAGGGADCADMSALCTTHCDALAAQADVLMCATSGIVASECISSCEQLLATSTDCTCEYLDWNQCLVDAGANGLVCDLDGETVFNPAVCNTEAMAYGACTN